MYDCEQGKGIHSPAQCSGNGFFRGTGLLMVMCKTTCWIHGNFSLENTAQPTTGHTAKHCWFLGARGGGGVVTPRRMNRYVE